MQAPRSASPLPEAGLLRLLQSWSSQYLSSYFLLLHLILGGQLSPFVRSPRGAHHLGWTQGSHVQERPTAGLQGGLEDTKLCRGIFPMACPGSLAGVKFPPGKGLVKDSGAGKARLAPGSPRCGGRFTRLPLATQLRLLFLLWDFSFSIWAPPCAPLPHCKETPGSPCLQGFQREVTGEVFCGV